MIVQAIALPLVLLLAETGVDAAEQQTAIDRHAVMTRHNVTLTSFGVDVPRNKQSAWPVGSGHFAFGRDVAGLLASTHSSRQHRCAGLRPRQRGRLGLTHSLPDEDHLARVEGQGRTVL